MSEQTQDLIGALEAEHANLRRLFAQWAGASLAERPSVLDEICLQLAIHARLEEELLQPLVRRALGRHHGLDQGETARAARARELMSRVLQPGLSAGQQAQLMGLLEQAFEQHVQLQAGRVFPRLRRCGADLALLGRRLRERRRELERVPEALREDALVG